MNLHAAACASIRTSIVRAVAVTLVFFAASCDHGLSPEMGRVGFDGTVTEISPEAPGDSLFNLRVVAVRTFPPGEILAEYLNGTLIFSDALILHEQQQTYRIEATELKGSFEYVAVAQQYGPNPFEDWRVVGVYSVSGNSSLPSTVDVGSGTYLRGIDIRVDFLNLPPQPF